MKAVVMHEYGGPDVTYAEVRDDRGPKASSKTEEARHMLCIRGMTMQAFRKAHANAPDSRSRRIPAATKAGRHAVTHACVGRHMVPMRVCQVQVRERPHTGAMAT